MLSSSETEAAFASAVAAVIDERDLVVVDGPEAVSYLHGQVSQNVTSLGIGESAWTLLLQPQGKVDAWMRMTRTSDERIVFDVDKGHGAPALARLERFKLRTKATFELRTVKRVAVRGPESPARPTIESDEILSVDLEWPGADGFDLLGDDAMIPEGIPEGPSSALEAFRIVLGMPAMGAELTEATIPAEAGIVDLSVDFTKGCYVGQELVARVDSRGNNTPRRIHRLRLDTEQLVASGAAITVSGDAVGTITSAAMTSTGAVALGSIKRGTDIDQGAIVATADGDVAASIEPIELG